MCYWNPNNLTKEDVFERINNWLSYGAREGFPTPTSLDIGPNYLNIIGGEQEFYSTYTNVWLYHGKKALL